MNTLGPFENMFTIKLTIKSVNFLTEKISSIRLKQLVYISTIVINFTNYALYCLHK